jgi:hypothetical protein
MLTNDQILKILRSAFQPFDCGADIRDHGEEVRFKIFKEDGALVLSEKSKTSLIHDPENLKAWILGVREVLDRADYELEPWIFPEASQT